MAEHRPLTRQERERLHTRIHANVERALAEYDDDDWADMCMRGLGYILRYEATVATLETEVTDAKDNYQAMLDTACQEVKKRQELEADNARLRPLADVGESIQNLLPRIGDSTAELICSVSCGGTIHYAVGYHSYEHYSFNDKMGQTSWYTNPDDAIREYNAMKESTLRDDKDITDDQ